MTQKLKWLIAANIALILALAASLTDWQAISLQDSAAYAISDSAGVNRILLGALRLERKPTGTWMVNDRYEVQPEAIRTLLAVGKRLEVRRPVSDEGHSAAQKLLAEQGIEVQFFVGEKLDRRYRVAKSGEETLAATEGADPDYVHVPGYFLDIAGIFSAPEADWRDRRLLNTSWRSLKSFSVQYPTDPTADLTIRYDSVFYRVDDIQALDSMRLYEYIEQLPTFTAAAFTADPVLADSAAKTKPAAIIRLQDLYAQADNVLTLYPVRGGTLGYSARHQEWVLIEPRELRKILLKRGYFAARPQRKP